MKANTVNKFGIFIILGACSLFLTAGTAAAASAKYAAADNVLTTCSITSNGTLSSSTPLVTLAGLTSCTGTDITTGANGSSATATMDGPNWVVINTITLHVSSSQSIFVTPSLVTGLYTEVKNTNQVGSSSSDAQVLLRVVNLTGCTLSSNNYGSASSPCSSEVAADPVVDCTSNVFGCVGDNGEYGVNFDQRILGLNTSLGSGEFIDLAIATAEGHSFGFGFDDLSAGTYTVAVEAAINVGTNSSNSISAAAFGLGFTTAEAVQMTQGANDMDF